MLLFMLTFFLCGEARRQLDIGERLGHLVANGLRSLNYFSGNGVSSAVARSNRQLAPIGIRVSDVFDCNVVTFQSPSAIGAAHISPYCLSEAEGRPTSFEFELADVNYLGHIYSVLQGIYSSGKSFELCTPPISDKLDLKRVQKDIDSGTLRCSIICGNSALAGNLFAKLTSSTNRTAEHVVANDLSVKLPVFRANMYDFWESRKDVFLFRDGLFSSNSKLFYQQGVNFPGEEKK